MKKGLKLLFVMCLAIGLIIAFTGCASTKFNNNILMNPDYPITDHAVLYFNGMSPHVTALGNITDVTIDGDLLLDGDGIITNGTIILLTPGTHTIEALYTDPDIRRMDKYYEYRHSIRQVLTSNFVAGHHYVIHARRHIFKVAGSNFDSVSLKITDVTDLSLVNADNTLSDLEKVYLQGNSQNINEAIQKNNNLTYPNELALSHSYVPMRQEAQKALPTSLEGIWRREGERGSYKRQYIFVGKTFNYIQHIDYPRIFESNGVFELIDNKILLTTLSQLRSKTPRVMVNMKAETSEYAYTLIDDTLTLSNGKETAIYKKVTR